MSSHVITCLVRSPPPLGMTRTLTRREPEPRSLELTRWESQIPSRDSKDKRKVVIWIGYDMGLFLFFEEPISSSTLQDLKQTNNFHPNFKYKLWLVWCPVRPSNFINSQGLDHWFPFWTFCDIGFGMGLDWGPSLAI